MTLGLTARKPSDSVPPGDRPLWRSHRTWAGLEIVAFVVVPLLVLVAVAAATVLISERVARDSAVSDAERIATRFTRLLLTPLLERALEQHSDDAWAELDRVVVNRLSDGSITFIAVWSPEGAEGVLLYSSETSAIGQRWPMSDDLRRAFDGAIVSQIDEDPEASYQGAAEGPLVEVYVPGSARGREIVVEAYFSYDGIEREAELLRGEIIPLAVGALVVLQLVQLPIATALARRVRRQETERAELMQRNLTASERERRSIAADVHDGPVQDLAGASYALGALRSSVPEQRRPDVDRLLVALRRAVHSLRRLMVDLYPPDLSGPGLADALEDLARTMRDDGVEVSVHAAPVPELSPDNAAVLYRTAKEALANVRKHADAMRVWITLEPVEDRAGSAVRLRVTDDGIGFPAAVTEGHSEGHVGLLLAAERVRDVGGSLVLSERPGGGAALTAVVPVGSPA
jgi:signal transduction histidine kinase